MPNRDPNEIGALWAKSGKKGEYLTGVVNGVKVVCFKVRQLNDKSPTYRVLKSVPREAQEPAFDEPSLPVEALDVEDIGF